MSGPPEKRELVKHVASNPYEESIAAAIPGFRTTDYLPDWSRQRFLLLDPAERWHVPLTTELTRRMQQRPEFTGRVPECESCRTARDVLLFADERATIGLILFMPEIERETLTLLGRLSRSPRNLPILAVCHQRHNELLPALLEAGVHTALFDVVNDVPLADWCLRIFDQRSAAAKRVDR